MLRSLLFKLVLFAVLSPVLARAQASSQIRFSPPFLIAGSGPGSLALGYNGEIGPDIRIRWNGSDRPTALQANNLGLQISLTAADVASAGLAEVTAYDSVSGAVVADSFIGIGYNVVPRGVVYDSTRNRFYVVTPSTSKDPRFPANSVVALDPDSEQTGPIYSDSTFLGQAALSDDASTLYVVGEGDNAVRQFDAGSLSLVKSFPFRGAAGKPPSSDFGYPSSIAVMPGHPQTIAINYAPVFDSSATSVAIFDNGVKRPKEAEPGGAGVLFSSDGAFLFTSGKRLAVDGSGFPSPAGLTGIGGDPVVIANGLLFAQGGRVLDASSMLLAGNLGAPGSIAVDPANKRALLLMGANPSLPTNVESLQAFDLDTLEPLGSIPLPGIDSSLNSNLPWYQNLIRFGTDGVLYQAATALMVFHTPLAGPAPATSANAVVNAASSVGGAIAPGEALTIYGNNLGPAVPATPVMGRYQPVSSTLAHVQVWFDDLPAPILLSYQGQLNVIAPFELKPGSNVHLQVWYYGIPSNQVLLPVAAAAPGLFTANSSGGGPAAVVNQDGSVDQPSTPGTYISLYGTGGGTLPGASDGAIAYAAVTLTNSAQVTIDGQDAFVSYAGAAPTLPDGVIQINAIVPSGVRSGTQVPLKVVIGGQSSPQGVTLAIR